MRSVPWSGPANLLRLGLLVVLLTNPAAAQVVINEVVSANLDGLAEVDGSHPDWIELYNPSASVVDLAGWGLSDDPEEPLKYVLPPVRIAAGGHLMVLASGADLHASRWETVIPPGHSWRYRTGDSRPPEDWFERGFDDGGWADGPSGFGTGDGDDATTVVTPTLYLRARFEVADPSAVALPVLHVDYDDAFVAYLNGVEVARANIGVENVPAYYRTRARSEHEAAMYAGGDPETFILDGTAALLTAGTNVLAVQIHDHLEQPDDMTAVPMLTLGYSGPSGQANAVPPELAHLLPRLQAGFEIDSAGETVVLADPSGMIVDQLEAPRLYFGQSAGREPDGAANLLLFPHPSPAATNGGGLEGFAAPADFSLAAGFYPGPVDVELTSASGVVRYTLDGSEPDLTSAVTAGPIHLTRTTVVRARAWESGRMPSRIRTRTYLIDEGTTTPVVSVSTAPANLFDEATGIYVLGPEHDPEYPYYGANFWQDWERPVHVEIFDERGERELNEGAGVKIHGNISRALPQRTLRLIARGGYGASAFEGRLFPDSDDDDHDTLLLRNAGNDWCSAQLRDGIVSRSVVDLDVDRLAFRPAVLFVNGEYWGLHNLRQRADEVTMAERHGLDRDRVDLLELQGKIMEGSNLHYLALLEYIERHGVTSSADLAYVRTQMDVDEYATYAILHIFHADTDWLASNVKFWRPQSPDGRWRWILYDLDFAMGLIHGDTFDSLAHDTLAWATDPDGVSWHNPDWSTFLLRKLLENEEFRRGFVNRYADLLNHTFAPGRMQGIVDEVRALVEAEMPRHVERWDCWLPYWEQQMAWIGTWIHERPAYARQHVVDNFDLAGTYRLSLDVEPAGAGAVDLTVVSVEGPWSGIYFRGNPVTLTARPQPGRVFAGWSGAASGGTSTVTVDPSGDATIVAHFAPASSAVVITEINYNSPPDFDPEDWVELHNAGGVPLDLSGWTLTDDDPSHVFTFPQGTLLPAGGYLVVPRDGAAFAAAFPEVAAVVPGGFLFALDNGGDAVRLLDAAGVEQDGVAYDDDAPWPLAADGDGPTLALAAPHLDNTLANAWYAGAVHGTPGQPNRPAGAPAPRTSPPVQRGPTVVRPL